MSLPQIGREFGNKHHTTVLHSINKIEATASDRPGTQRLIQTFIDSFK